MEQFLERASVVMVDSIGQRLTRLMKEKGITSFYRLSELTKKSGKQIQQASLKKIATGENSNPTPKTLKRIAIALDVKSSYFLEEETKPLQKESEDKVLGLVRSLEKLGTKELSYIGDVMQLPVRGYVRAGVPCVTEQEEGEYMIISRHVVESLTNRPGDVYTLRVEGESISGDKAHTGDFLLILPIQEIDINGDLYIIRDPENGESVVRHLRKEGDRVYVESSNPNYPPLALPKVEVIGRVIWIQPVGLKPQRF